MSASLPTSFQNEEVADHFVDVRRRAIPYGEDQLRMMLQMVTSFRPRPALLVDLGCGDGIVARTVLDAYPQARAILVDSSAPMLSRAEEAMAAHRDRCRFVSADLADPLPEVCHEEPADVIVSGYAIHHLPDLRKRALYEGVYAALRAGGLFINIEHVASPTPRMEAFYEALYIDHIAHVTRKDRDSVAREFHGRPDKADNILAPLDLQLTWLREIGFAEVDCYFKWTELAVFGGIRPAVQD
jgi:ubiquinone/menaquinone biosynthesis C-methylase UbiE